jgi:hypothetical protein
METAFRIIALVFVGAFFGYHIGIILSAIF